MLNCPACGFNFKPNQTTPLLSKFTPKAMPIEIPDADKDLETFIQRVVDKLVPIHADYSPANKKALTETRTKIQGEIEAVFNGKQTLEKWFIKTRKMLGIHQIDFTKILYDSLEGLRSKEAREMRTQYAEALTTLQQSYKPPV